MNSWEFLPTLDRITDEPPNKGAVTVARLVMALVAILIAWSFLGQLDVVVVAEGKLVPETYVKIVQPAEGGIVREILVREGDAVKQGQVLARLDDTLANADATAVRGNLALKQLELRRVQAELNGQPFRTHSGDDALLFRQVQEHYRASRTNVEESLSQAKEEASRASADLAAARQQQSRLEQLVPVFEKELAAYEGLRGKGYVSELDYNAKQRELIDARQGLAAQRDAIAGLEAAQRQAMRRAEQINANYRAELSQERAALTAEVQQLSQEAKRQTHRGELLELRAPQDGVVKDLATHTHGSVVQPGAVLMTLVPVHERLQAEVFVRNEDVGRLRSGLPVQVKVHAFRFQKYGMLGGEIVTLGADSSAQQGQEGQQQRMNPALYKALVAIKPVGDGLIDAQTLAAGMTVTVEVDVGSRTPFEYLVEPVRGVVGQAGRE
jgi:hemolysin D